jgi:hypothetical protein
MRLGAIANEPVELTPGQVFTLTTEDVAGGPTRALVSFRGCRAWRSRARSWTTVWSIWKSRQ